MKNFQNKKFNILEGFNDYSKLNKLIEDEQSIFYNQFYCNICKAYQKAETRLQIIEPPNKLLIYIDYGYNMKYQPLNIQIDDIIDITKYIYFDYKEKIKYQLIGICCVYNLYRGDNNYITFCKNKENNRWYQFDDINLNEVVNRNIIYNGKPYLFLYERI